MKPIKQIHFRFSDGITPVGEVLSLHFDFFKDAVLDKQILTLNCYENKTEINLGACPFNPENLRKLADLLEEAEKEVEKKRKKHGL